MKKLTFKDEFITMTKRMAKEVIPDDQRVKMENDQRVKMEISFVQVQLFEFEFDFEDDNLHNTIL